MEDEETRYVSMIQDCGWEKLRDLWEQIEARTTGPDWNPGKALEYLVLRAFQLNGADVSWPYSVSIEGEVVEQIDGAVHTEGLSFLVESKDFDTEKVAIGAIAKLRNQLARRPPATFGVFFSRSGFTEPAILLLQYTSPQQILPWPGIELKFALEKETIIPLLILKYRRCIEHAIPNFDIRLWRPE